MFATCVEIKFNPYCMYCMYVYTCVLHVYVLISIHMCMYCVYHMYEHVCCLYYMYWPGQEQMLSQRAQNIARLGGNQRTPLRTTLGSSCATLSSDQGPIPRPDLAHQYALHAWGGGLSSPPAQPMGPPRAMGTWRAHHDPRPS